MERNPVVASVDIWKEQLNTWLLTGTPPFIMFGRQSCVLFPLDEEEASVRIENICRRSLKPNIKPTNWNGKYDDIWKGWNKGWIISMVVVGTFALANEPQLIIKLIFDYFVAEICRVGTILFLSFREYLKKISSDSSNWMVNMLCLFVLSFSWHAFLSSSPNIEICLNQVWIPCVAAHLEKAAQEMYP